MMGAKLVYFVGLCKSRFCFF